jgi:hypothetical protein
VDEGKDVFQEEPMGALRVFAWHGVTKQTPIRPHKAASFEAPKQAIEKTIIVPTSDKAPRQRHYMGCYIRANVG